jgi:hypothetical protein
MPEELSFDSWQGKDIPLSKAPRSTMQANKPPPILWVSEPLSAEVRQPTCDARHSPQSAAEVKNERSYTPTFPYAFKAVKGAWLLQFTEVRYTNFNLGIK